jgi:hypothetical protein
MILILLREGATLAIVVIVIAFLLSGFTRDIIGRGFLIILLFVAAGAYFGFTYLENSGVLILVALVQMLVFGTMGLLGLRGSPYWIAAGWALHPFWDLAMHFIGPDFGAGRITYYEIACVSFDWVIAVYIAIVYGLGLLGERRAVLRQGTPLLKRRATTGEH